jgi:hypothetical protein
VRLHINCQEGKGRLGATLARSDQGATRGKKHQILAPFNLTSLITTTHCSDHFPLFFYHRYVQLRSPCRRRPVQPAQGRCRPFTARFPFSTRRTWPACLPDRRFLGRDESLFPFFSAPASRMRLPFTTTRLTSTCSATAALTCTRSDPTAQLPKDRTTSTAAAPSRRAPSSPHRAAQLRGSPPARSFPLWCAPSRLLFAGPF